MTPQGPPSNSRLHPMDAIATPGTLQSPYLLRTLTDELHVGRTVRPTRSKMNHPRTSPPVFYSENVLLERIANASREIVFFFGSPLTIPEGVDQPGVPGVASIVDLIAEELGESPSAMAEALTLLANGDAGGAYRKAFAQLQAFRGQDTANRVIRRAVLSARMPGTDSAEQRARVTALTGFERVCGELEESPAGWYLRPSVRALGHLIAEHRARFGNVVLTTNFDPLIQVSVQRAGGRHLRTVLHDDGSLRKANAPGVQIVHLHGYWHGSDTLHVPAQLEQPRPQLRRSLEDRSG